MKKRGTTLVEMLVVVALLGVIFLMFIPLIGSYSDLHQRMRTQSKVDNRLKEVTEIIKRRVRGAKSHNRLGNQPIAIFSTSGSSLALQAPSDTTTGSVIVINEYDIRSDEWQFLKFQVQDNKLKVSSLVRGENEGSTVTDEDFNNFIKNTGTANDNLLNNLEFGSFSYSHRILKFHFTIDIPESLEGKLDNDIVDTATTRIDIDL